MTYSAPHTSDDQADRHAEEIQVLLNLPGRERIRSFYNYWQSKRKGSRFPERSDIDPLEITSLLGHVFLADILDETPTDYRYRLVGTDIVEIDGECTGMRLSEMLPDRSLYHNLWQQYDAIRDGRYWLRVETLPHRQKGHLIPYEVLLLPLVDRKGKIVMIFGYAAAGDRRTG
ncbi:PAS domain-containing protein [Aestuariispira insulae]|uniref:PAS domain-containing protein n=1 Tax=Aestuariispira insulae TaxID=1461337 RepID=A0A3D9HQD1_9PROT|nr:PAS domain-containing protein [Aestuariispira insulae]RED51605.1 PAS domain-containing protein [Aestuariispira insulae]